MTVFVTSGAELRATVTLEGPVAPLSAKTGKEISTATRSYKHGTRFSHKISSDIPPDDVHERHEMIDEAGNLYHVEPLDFEHTDNENDEEEFEDDDDHWAFDDQGLEDVETDIKSHPMRDLRDRVEGDPWEITVQVMSDGWYRGCVTGSWYRIAAEIELRKESELGWYGSADRVKTYEEANLHRIGKEIDESELEGGIGSAKSQLKVLNHLIAGIREKQWEEKRRLEVHAAKNEHSHSRMVLGSLAETVLFIVVTGFQVFTVRKWFQGGDPLLGK